MVLAAMVLVGVSPALSLESFDMRVGESKCLQLSGVVGLHSFGLVGPYHGPGNPPILVLQAGCDAATTSCDSTCTAIEPPSWPFEFIVDSTSLCPPPPGNHCYHGGGYYWGSSMCLIDFKVYWVHDNYWTVEIFTFCDGCFCFAFEGQEAVELSSPLAATAGVNEVTLRWATASESQNDRFEIFRDGAWVESVAGLGTSTSGRAYRWTDETVSNGITYAYTLESVDFNGTRHALGQVTATPSAEAPGAVSDYRLYQNYPNPFNPTTRISFDLPSKTTVMLKVYNPMGAAVVTLVNGEREAGRHWAEFDGTNLTSGLYFCTMQTSEGFSATRKMLLVK
jgi:hypothetical protein